MGGICGGGAADDADIDIDMDKKEKLKVNGNTNTYDNEHKNNNDALIQETHMDQETIERNQMKVGLFYGTFISLQYSNADAAKVITLSDETKTMAEMVAEKKAMKQYIKEVMSVLKKACMGDGYFAPSEKAYVIAHAKHWFLTDEEIEEAFAMDVSAKDLPFGDQNPFAKYKIFGKPLTANVMAKHILFDTIVASAQDGLQSGELDVVYEYADELNVDRAIVDEFIHTLNLEQDLFLRWKKLL